jgi:hypothetical protein
VFQAEINELVHLQPLIHKYENEETKRLECVLNCSCRSLRMYVCMYTCMRCLWLAAKTALKSEWVVLRTTVLQSLQEGTGVDADWDGMDGGHNQKV